MALRPGDRLAERYRLIQPLGQGGMATVFLADDERARTPRVVKQLHVDDAELLAHFRNEFALLSRITHRNLARVHDFGAWRVRGERYHYYTADFVEAVPVSSWARQAAEKDLVRPLVDALAGLSALHALGIRHGDVSPDNVLVQSDGSGLLIDLGCARPFARSGAQVAGTPGFIAPEVLAHGAGDARADLYSLGQTLRFLHELVGKKPSGRLAELCDRLTATEPSARPASAREVLEALGRRVAALPALEVTPRQLVGRDAEVALFRDWLLRAKSEHSSPRIFWMSGGSGVGSSRLLREFVALGELELDVLRARGEEVAPVSWLLRAALPGEVFGSGVGEMVRAGSLLGERPEPLLLVLEDAQRLDSLELSRLLSLLRSLPETSNVTALVSSQQRPSALAAQELELKPLSRAGLGAWTCESLSVGALDELYEHTRGVPARVERALLARARGSNVAGESENQAALVEAALAGASSAERSALASLLARDGEQEVDRAGGDLVRDLGRFIECGLVGRDADWLRLADARMRPELQRALANELPAAHRSAADWFARPESNPEPEVRASELVFHTLCAGDAAAAEALFRAAEPFWRERPRVFARRLLPAFRAQAAATFVLSWAELALLAGEHHQVLSAGARLLRARRRDDSERQMRLFVADALLRLGRGPRVERFLRKLCDEDAAPVWRARALERCARAKLSSDPKASAVLAERGLGLSPDATTARALRELLGLAASYLGQSTEAQARFGELLAELPSDASPRERSRLHGQRAIASFRAGLASAALDDYRAALELSDRHGLDDLLCVNCLNLGTAQQKLGDLGGALGSYERGLRVAHALGRESTELTLRFNLANLLTEVGDFARAEAELSALERGPGNAQREHLAPLIALIRAEIATEQREFARAEKELERAQSEFETKGLTRELCEVSICRAELELGRENPSLSRELAERAIRVAASLEAHDLRLRARAVVARALLAEHDTSALGELERLANEADTAGERVLAARLTSELYRGELVLKLPTAALRGARAWRAWDQLCAELPEALRETFWRDARRADLAQRTRVEPLRGADGDSEALRKLLSLGRRVNSSLSLERVFEYAVDAALELTQAERAFLLLDAEDGPRVVAQRPESLAAPPSRAIIERVVQSEEPLLTTDAQADQRFASPGSIHSMKLKSVLCVPVLTPSERIGLLYVDSRVQRVRFQQRERELLTALSDQVAVAVANARLHRALEQQREELSQQKRVIERLSREKDRELERLRERVHEQERSLTLRYDYSRIVGQGPAMRRVFEQLDRITDSSVDVLVQGESGTGKELVARALHQNGPRRQAGFVGINCAALPENLLESELFGHVRGAFTGADRDKRGLLLEAHGGTLFLDEIAELPLGMQAKLLRVLQEREVRPVGGTKSTPVDVRIVSATHRDLRAWVESGRFREDLFYRLAVVVVRLPPLRERMEDLPAIARRILERLARDAACEPPELTNEALRKLSAHAFPGNVRELENALTRAFVLRSGARLSGVDFELGKSAARQSSKNRREFQDEEREQIVSALRRTHWNVSLVSRELGIPRNTLYRKLRRYGLEERPSELNEGAARSPAPRPTR